MINSLQDAFHLLDEQKYGIPLEAIEYLKNQPTSKEITEKVVFALRNAYKKGVYYDDNDYWMPTPLWYSIVAESHLSQDLVDPTIKLFTTTNDDWDFLNEQGMYLLGKLAEKYGDEVIIKVRKVVDDVVAKGSDLPYLFLFDVFYFADIEKYKSWMLDTLKKEFFWDENFSVVIAELKIKEAIPILKERLKKIKDPQFIRSEFEYALKILEKGSFLSDDEGKPYCATRGDWKVHYKRFENRFKEDDENVEDFEEEFDPESPHIEKIGRNDPCLCNSGKKYKKCCLPNEVVSADV